MRTKPFPALNTEAVIAQDVFFNMTRLTFGSLFAGIGGFDLGLERAGMQCSWQVEINDYANRVLEKHWPDVKRYRDVRRCGAHNLEAVELICGGFPCQPHSLAGKRGASADKRDLWAEFARIIGELRPKWVLAENVPGLLSSESGWFFGRILRDLAACGYVVEWQCLPACVFGAPHKRDRLWIIAQRCCNRQSYEYWNKPDDTKMPEENYQTDAPDHWGERIQGFWKEPIQRVEEFSWCQNVRGVEDLRGRSDLPEPLICRNCDGFSHRVDRLRCLGNAVVPQVVEYIGKQILEYDG